MKKFTQFSDVEHFDDLLNLAMTFKKDPYAMEQLGKRKTLGLVFFNPSLRTRLSTQKAAQQLGMNVLVMDFNSDGWKIETTDGAIMNAGTQEHIREAAGVLSQYCDIVGIRTFPGLLDQSLDYSEHVLQQFIRFSSIPIFSLESATLHPLQSFADAFTIEEHKTVLRPKVVLTWAPHVRSLPQCVANSFVDWMKNAAADLIITHPVGMDLSAEYTNGVPIYHDQNEALKGADFVYAKNWSSFSTYGTLAENCDDWMITNKKMALTNNGKLMHCLPVRRNVEVADEVLDGPNSLVMQQAMNRTYTAQAVLAQLLMEIEGK